MHKLYNQNCNDPTWWQDKIKKRKTKTITEEVNDNRKTKNKTNKKKKIKIKCHFIIQYYSKNSKAKTIKTY